MEFTLLDDTSSETTKRLDTTGIPASSRATACGGLRPQRCLQLTTFPRLRMDFLVARRLEWNGYGCWTHGGVTSKGQPRRRWTTLPATSRATAATRSRQLRPRRTLEDNSCDLASYGCTAPTRNYDSHGGGGRRIPATSRAIGCTTNCLELRRHGDGGRGILRLRVLRRTDPAACIDILSNNRGWDVFGVRLCRELWTGAEGFWTKCGICGAQVRLRMRIL